MENSDLVTLQLHDLRFSDQCKEFSSSEQQENSYISMLKQKLRETNEIPFSMNFNSQPYEIGKKIIEKDNDQSEYMSVYDVEIVNDRNLLIFATRTNKLHIFQLETKKRLKTIIMPVKDIHEIVVDGLYLYLTTGNSLCKYNFNELLRIEDQGVSTPESLIWTASQSGLSNCWGLALHSMNNSQKYAYVMDYGSGIFIFDTVTGNSIHSISVPKILEGYGIAFTEDNEMIISISDRETGPIQILKFDSSSSKWEIREEVKRVAGSFQSPYGISYERKTKLIYLVDTTEQSVSVIAKNNMEIVNQWDSSHLSGSIYGISLDTKKGELYLPICDYSINIYR